MRSLDADMALGSGDVAVDGEDDVGGILVETGIYLSKGSEKFVV